MSLEHSKHTEDLQRNFPGALTLLRDCVGGQAGERLLLVQESQGNHYYDTGVPALTASAGRALGMQVYITEIDPCLDNSKQRQQLSDTLRGFDHIVFFSRVGDQIRFADNSDIPSATMCYTLDLDSLTSEFGTACYQGLCQVKEAIDLAVMSAKQIRVTCPRGTDYVGYADFAGAKPVEVTLKRFPMLVPQPTPALGFSGRIALSRFLTNNNHCDPHPDCLPLPSVVYACLEGNRITGFEGDAMVVDRITDLYRQLGAALDIEPWFVDSWHAGIHPGCQFTSDAASDINRWAGSTFGSPRLLHFHTCGEYAPGEIAWHVFDPTIYLDDTPVWEDGRLYPERLPNSDSLLEACPQLAALYQNPCQEIGLST